MPSMSAHMAIACKLVNELNVNKEEFIKGNLLPDLYDDKVKSHFKVKGKKYYIPDIEKVINSLDLNQSINLGYLSHLLLDKYYFDEYLIKFNLDLFKNYSIYNDYDILNKYIINYFNIDIKKLKKILKDFPNDIDKSKLINNINCLDLDIGGDTKILDKNDFIKFLNNSINRIKNDINSIINKKQFT